MNQEKFNSNNLKITIHNNNTVKVNVKLTLEKAIKA